MLDKSQSYDKVELQDDMSYVEKSLKIIDEEEEVLRNKTIPIVKVLWRDHAFEEGGYMGNRNGYKVQISGIIFLIMLNLGTKFP